MEIDSGQTPVEDILPLRRTAKFEIGEKEFQEISVDSQRIIAKGKAWTAFELLVSFIGAAWMEKWRKYGLGLLAAGIILLLLPIIGFTIPGINLLLYSPGGFYLMLPLMALGLVLILLWIIAKREAIQIYTPGGVFKIEGSAQFVEDVWKAITEAQRRRDI